MKIVGERTISKSKVNNQIYRELGDKWYDAVDDPIALLRAENAFRLKWLKEELAPSKSGSLKILDVGCGAGLLSNPLAELGHSVSGLDLAEEALQVARSRDSSSRVTYKQGSAEAIPWGAQEFDVVCCFDVLEHVDAPSKVVGEIGRVLRPGGHFYFFTFNRTFLSYLLGIKALEWFLRNTPENLHVFENFIRPSELIEMCEQFGMQPEFLRGFGPRLLQPAMLDLLLKRQVRSDFRFEFKKSKAVSYLGRARKRE